MAGVPMRCTMVSVVTVRGTGEQARTLLLRRAGAYLHGAWAYVAGHVEPGEAGWRTALRELLEETALRPSALYSANRCEVYYDAADDCISVVPAFVAFVDGDAQVRLDAEHDAYAWLAFPEAIARLPFDGQRALYRGVRRAFVQRPPVAALRIPDG